MSIFQNPRLRYKKLLIILLPIFIVFVVMLFLSYNAVLKSFGSENAISNNEKKYDIESMNYHLRSNATDYQIELFEELREAVEADDEQRIIEEVAKNFIADVYTWTNKEDMWDVGGMCYVYSRYKTTTYFELRDNLYQLMAKTKRELEDSEQLLVTGVDISSCTKCNELYQIENNKYEAYDVVCHISYSGDKIKGYLTHNQYLTIIKNTDEGGRFEIAASHGD